MDELEAKRQELMSRARRAAELEGELAAREGQLAASEGEGRQKDRKVAELAQVSRHAVGLGLGLGT